MTEIVEALTAAKIENSEEAIRDVVSTLEMDYGPDGGVSLFEMTRQLASYRRKRRHTVAKLLHECSMYLKRTNQSATRVFARCNANNTGNLDATEMNDVMKRMGHNLSPDETAERLWLSWTWMGAVR